MDAHIVVYTHIGVGFGVARFDKQAMPEPLCVGRATSRLPRFFYSVDTSKQQLSCLGIKDWVHIEMNNIIIGCIGEKEIQETIENFSDIYSRTDRNSKNNKQSVNFTLSVRLA